MKKTAILVASLAFLVTITDIKAGPGLIEWTNFLTKVEQVCINSSGISRTVIDKTKLELELPNDPQYKKYIGCFYRKQGYQNEDGDILFYNIQNMITDLANATLASEIVNQCKDIEKIPTNEDYAYNVARCLLIASKSRLHQPQADEAIDDDD